MAWRYEKVSYGNLNSTQKNKTKIPKNKTISYLARKF